MIQLDFHKDAYEIILEEPKLLKIKLNEIDEEYGFFTMSREVCNFIYKAIGIKYGQSKAIFEADRGYWIEFIKVEMENAKFDFSNYSFITAGDKIISIFDNIIDISTLEKSYNEAKKIINEIPEKEKKEIFDLDEYLEKVIITTSEQNENQPYGTVVIIENDYLNSKYFITSGIVIDKMIWPHSTKSLSVGTLVELFSKINLQDEIDLSKKFGEAIYKDFKFDGNYLPTTNLSLNELFTILKHAGIGIEIQKDKHEDDFGEATELIGIGEGSIIGDKILSSLNSFDIPAKPLMRLQSLKKSFKDSNISFKDILTLFTMEYMNIRIKIKIDEFISLKTLFVKHANDSSIIEKEIKLLNI